MFADSVREMLVDTNKNLEFIGKRMGYAHDLASKRAALNDELQCLPITVDERLDVGEIISHDATKLDMFFSLNHDDKYRWVMRIFATAG